MSRAGWLVGAAVALGVTLLLWRLDHVNGELDAARAAHAVTLRECERWKTAAEAYRREAEAQTENAGLCLEREANAAREAVERAAIVKQARLRFRTAEERKKVVDDETRRRAVLRLNRPLQLLRPQP